MNAKTLILLVEDAPADQLLVRSVLEHADFQVDVAGTAPDARRRLSMIAPALILMDIQLPGEDGPPPDPAAQKHAAHGLRTDCGFDRARH